MQKLPTTGVLTFLFTDIEGSTIRWERYPEAMQTAIVHHDNLMYNIVEKHHGMVFKTVGDAFYVVFDSANNAINAAIEAQRLLSLAVWDEDINPIRVRIALHTGEAEHRGADYFGQTLNRVARILSSAHGGQMLLSQVTYRLIKDKTIHDVELLDMGEHRLKDIQSPEQIFQVVAADLPSTFPPLKTLDSHPNNLPTQLTPFVGRQKDLANVSCLLLKEEVRLVSLIGSGGVGKTRLGLQVAADIADQFSNGVYFIDLEMVRDKNNLVDTIVRILGINSRSSGIYDTLSQIKNHIGKNKTLLLLDNCEQVEGVSSIIHEILIFCLNLKILVTSRIKLYLGGEHEYHVLPFEIPDIRLSTGIVEIAQYEAVMLFLQQAKTVKPDFQLTDKNFKAVADICKHIDGLPLAIELAAARVNVLPPQSLVKRIKNQMKLLLSKESNRSIRHQTLHNTIAWSHELLNNHEKELLKRLSVFSGGCSIEAVEIVCCMQDDIDLFDLLRVLTEKSLLRQQEQEDGEPRFIMMSSIRQFNKELFSTQECMLYCQKHCEYYVQFLEEIIPDLNDINQKICLSRLNAEHSNILTALEWCEEHHEVLSGLRICGLLWRFWWMCGYVSEGRYWLEKFLAQEKISSVSVAIKAKALVGVGALSYRQNDFEQAKAIAQEALQLGKHLGDREIESEAYITLGEVAISQSNIEQANQFFEESLKICRILGNKKGIARLLNNLGNVSLLENKHNKAAMLLEESLHIFRSINDEWSMAAVLNNIGEIELRRSNFEQAAIFYKESLSIRRKIGYYWGVAASLANLGKATRYLGDYNKSLGLYKESLSLFVHINDHRGISLCLAEIAEISYLCNNLEQATRLFAQADLIGSNVINAYDYLPYENSIASLRSSLGVSLFEAIWTTGRASLMEKVIDEANSTTI